jgi:hypothetical protein
MTDFPEALPTYWHGRKWDAPMSDDAIEMPEDLAAVLLVGPSICDFCKEPLLFEDDVMLTPYMSSHLECNVRSALGDVQHLEGRCGVCTNTEPVVLPTDEYETYRESAKATIQWLIDNNRGRFHD